VTLVRSAVYKLSYLLTYLLWNFLSEFVNISQVSLVVAGSLERWTLWRSYAPGRFVPCVKEKASHDPFAVTHCLTCSAFVSDIAVFVLKRDVKLQLTN